VQQSTFAAGLQEPPAVLQRITLTCGREKRCPACDVGFPRARTNYVFSKTALAACPDTDVDLDIIGEIV
jgi:hypothetical protein